MMTTYSNSTLRTLALHVQGLTTANAIQQDTSREGIYRLIDQMSGVQIDTLQMIHRAQYVTLWSRLGSYDIETFDSLAYDSNHRHLFEYWYHAACLIPLKDFRYYAHMMQAFKDNPWRSYQRFLKDGGREVLAHVRKRIENEGSLRGADFKHEKKRSGSWWNWKPAKRALEYYFNAGELMIADRDNFHRVYDLQQRVLPAWVDTTLPTYDEYMRWFLERGVKGMGVCFPNQATDFVHDIQKTPARPYIEALIKEGVFVEIDGELHSGEAATLIVHRDNMQLLHRIADGEIQAERTTFLEPFDNLFWVQKRDMQLWGFNQVLEAYKKPKDRVWGYFCLPILHRDALVGRFDVKLDRKSGTLHIISLYVDDVSLPDLTPSLATAMRDFMEFHNATDIAIHNSKPTDAKRNLVKAI